jgi:alkaline phosphatase
MEIQSMSRRAIRASGFIALLAAAALVAAGCAHVTGRSGTPPRNVILMIGDGMGTAHVTAAKVVAGRLEMERLPVGGFVTTHPHGQFITDSAASGTAFATGEKTYNGAISVSPSKEPLRTVLEHAEERGMATGLVVTCSVTHATPAVFAAHVDSRQKDNEIAKQMASSGVDVLFGGGRSFFLPRRLSGARDDDEDLLEALRLRMSVALSAGEFRMLGDVEAAAALLSSEHPPPVGTRDPPLNELTEKALEILSRDEDGFFLMVEGSQIDWAGHENDHEWLVAETIDFDRAVGVVMDFAERNPGTLVVVTADHETGGYALLDGSIERKALSNPHFGCDDHTATMVPLLAYGPGSESLGGILDNTEIGRALIGFVQGGP